MSMVWGGYGYGYVCGTYGPLQWFNQGPGNVETALYGSPLGTFLNAPAFFGCDPTGVTIKTKNSSEFGNFTYSTLEEDLHLVEKIDLKTLNLANTFQKDGTNNILLSAFTLKQTTFQQDGSFSYKPSSPHDLYNLTHTVKSTQKMARRRWALNGLLNPHVLVEREMGRRRGYRRVGANVTNTYTTILSYTNEYLPKLPSSALVYTNGKETSQLKYSYATINKGALVGTENITLVSNSTGGSEVYQYHFHYSTEFNLLNSIDLTSGNSRDTQQISFKYDDHNRLTSIQTSDNNITIIYDSAGHLSSFAGSKEGYTCTFENK